MKVLVIAPIYPTADNPQAGIFVHRQIVNLAKQGLDCRVLTYRPAPPTFPLWLRRRSWLRYYWRRWRWQSLRDGISTTEVFYQRDWSEGADEVPAIGEALISYIESHAELRDSEILYAHFLWTGGAVALQLRERFGWPVVAIARGSEMHNWQTRNPHCRHYVERVIKEADQVLANCEDLRDRADQLVPGAKSRIKVVYNGCDAAMFQPAKDKRALRRTLALSETNSILLFCGTIEERKGIGDLATAWQAFSGQYPDWELVTVGRTIDQSLAAKLKANSNGRVRLIGAVSHETVLRYLQAADAYIQPSRLEGLANATMEAMAVGLPVITTDTCGQRELIQDQVNGWLVPTEDPQALKRALLDLAAQPEKAACFGLAARQTIENQFDAQRQAASLADLLHRVKNSAQTMPCV